MSDWYTEMESPIGRLTLTHDGIALTGLYVETPAPSGAKRNDAPFKDVLAQLGEYWAGERQEFDLPLAPQGTPFQLKVWEALRTIPYAETRSYGDIARQIGRPTAPRAVGAANGRNPISIIVPCHRVIGSSGKLVGYGWGLDRKQVLLDLEARSSN